MNKAQKIEAMLSKGKSPAEIAAKLKTSRQYVYAIASKIKKEDKVEQVEAIHLSWWQRIIKWLKGE